MLVHGAFRVCWVRSVIFRCSLHHSRLVLWLATGRRRCFVKGLHWPWVPNLVTLCRIGNCLTWEPDYPEWLFILRRFGAVVSLPMLKTRLVFPRFPILILDRPASSIELDIDRGRLVFLLLRVEWLWAFNLFAIIATTAIAGVLFRWVCLAVFGTKVGYVVSALAAGTCPVYLSAFVGFFQSHSAGAKLARLLPLDLLDLPDFELPVPDLLELLEVFSAGSEMNGRKLRFL